MYQVAVYGSSGELLEIIETAGQGNAAIELAKQRANTAAYATVTDAKCRIVAIELAWAFRDGRNLLTVTPPRRPQDRRHLMR